MVSKLSSAADQRGSVIKPGNLASEPFSAGAADIPALSVTGKRVFVNSGSRALVVVMEAAEFGKLNHTAAVGRMNCPSFRAIHLQGLMNSPAMVVAEVAGKDLPQMFLIQHNHMI